MTRILGIILALTLAAAIVPQGSAPAEAAKRKAAKNSSGAPIANGMEILGIAWGGPTMAPSPKKRFKRR